MPSQTTDTLVRMLDDGDRRWRAIEKLEALDGEAKFSVTKLWDIVWDRNKEATVPVNQRISALRAIGTIDRQNPELARGLFSLVTNNQVNLAIRLQATDLIYGLGKSARNVEEDLKKYINDNPLGEELNRALTKAFKQIHGNPEGLFKEIIQKLKSLDKNCWLEVSVLSELELSKANHSKALDALWDYMQKVSDEGNDPLIIPYVFQCILDMSENDEKVFSKLWENKDIPIHNKIEIVSHSFFLSNLVDNYKNESARTEVRMIIVMALGKDQEWIRNGVLKLLLKLQSEKLLSKEDSNQLMEAVRNCLNTHNQGLALVFISRMDKEEGHLWLDSHADAKSAIGMFFFWDDFGRSLLNERWNKNQQVTLAYVLKALKDLDDSITVLEWLKNKIAGVESESLCEDIKKALDDIQHEGEYADDNDRNKIKDAIELVDQRLQVLRPANLLKAIKAAHTDSQDDILVEKIELLVKMPSPVELRGLIDVWLRWIAENQNPVLIEATAGFMRDCYLAVLPLVDNMNETAGNIAQIREMKTLGSDKQKKEIEQQQEYEEKRNQAKYRRIARQIAAMSDQRLYTDNNKYAQIKSALENYAVPTMIKWLPNETDIEVRESMARALGNIGGRDAISALVHAVVDEEKKRQARQSLLAEYYLQPAKKYGDQASEILQGAVIEAKNTLRTLHALNIAVFVIGMLILVLGISVSLYSQNAFTRLSGAVAGLGGFLGVLYQLVNKPLERIQDAMANLVQLETAFTSFIWELNLNSTYIQSQYVANGILDDNDIGKTVGRIENAMSLAMKLVSTYMYRGQQRFVTRISPTTGKPGTSVTIYGQNLPNENTGKKDQTGFIAINHIPVQADGVSWKTDSIKFNLPQRVPGLEGQTGIIWISLLFDGVETNALPFNVAETYT